MNSPAAQVIVAIIPIVGIVFGATIVILALIWRHHERKMQIEAGTFTNNKFDLKSYALLFGLLLTGVGFLLSIFFAVMNGKSPSLLGGLVPLTIGICLLIFYKINPEFKNKQ